MLILIRALIWATLFVSFLLVFMPSRMFSFEPPAAYGPAQISGMILVALGGAFAFWCVMTFVFIGKGTAAPFDPPRYLVVRGPYRFVRNPMYIGAGIALSGASLFFRSGQLTAYLLFLWTVVHTLVVTYEEPTLRRTFGADYEEYCRLTNRWLPRWR